jgi:hypothetical protein
MDVNCTLPFLLINNRHFILFFYLCSYFVKFSIFVFKKMFVLVHLALLLSIWGKWAVTK